nr:hypothetical protein CFP56_77450 [Quercus suber]
MLPQQVFLGSTLPLVGVPRVPNVAPYECTPLMSRRAVLNTPLTPFTVLFCHIIADHHNVQGDLDLIRDYVASLRPACQLSDGIEKFYRMCSVFWRVAEAYVSAKQTEEASRLQNATTITRDLESVMGEFDGYLSSLGFAPVPQETGIDDPTSSVATSDMSSYLYDWYSGNASLYGLLEQNFEGLDLPNFDVFPQRPNSGVALCRYPGYNVSYFGTLSPMNIEENSRLNESRSQDSIETRQYAELASLSRGNREAASIVLR